MTEPSSDSLYEEAAAWVLRAPEVRDDHELATVFEAWRARSPAHAQAYADAVGVCELISEQATSPELLQRRRDALDRARAAGRRRWGPARPDRRMIAAGIAAAVAAPLAIMGWREFGAQTETYATDHGEQRTLVLADGSRMSLDALTKVEVTLARAERRIELVSGRMNVEVAKDPERPLKVRAGGSTVTALGTVFTVERGDKAVVVTLVEGRVAVRRPQGGPLEMKSGQELTVDPVGRASVRDKVDTERALAWREGKLIFDDEPLSAAASRMNNYGARRIVVEGAVQDLRISGVFRAGDVEAFVGAVESYFAVDAAWGATTVVLRAKSAPVTRTPA